MFVLGTCFACKKVFTFNPMLVPSYEGVPIYQDCITIVNERRKANGAPTWLVHPEAYEPTEVD
jgi:hypothetical protein